MAAKPVKRKNINDITLEQRIIGLFALIEISRMDVANISAADFEDLYKKISNINERAFEDEKALDLVAEHSLDEITNVDHLKERIYRSRTINIYKQLGYLKLSEGSVEQHKMSGPEVLATIMHEAGIKNADELSVAACTGTLDEEGTNRLHKELNGKLGFLKKRLSADFEVYNNQKSFDSFIELIRSDIEEYTYDKNKKATYGFSVRKEQKAFRYSIRDVFNNVTKPDFLKLYGTMLTEGKNTAKGSSFGSTYERFKEMIAAQTGKDSVLKEIDTALGISPEQAVAPNAESIRKNAYKNKCSELYFKTMAGLLSQKYEYNSRHNSSTDYATYVQTIEDKYIRELCNGYNNIDLLAFQDPDYKQQFESKSKEYQMNKERRDETAEMQIVSIHHKFPIGAVYDIYDQLLPSSVCATKVKKCSNLVNNRSNMVYVIGQDMHQSLEAKEKMEFHRQQDAMIFAARIDCKGLKSLLSKLPLYLREGIQKYVKTGEKETSKDISVAMNFSEPDEIRAIRQRLNSTAPHVTAAQKLNRYYAVTR